MCDPKQYAVIKQSIGTYTSVGITPSRLSGRSIFYVLLQDFVTCSGFVVSDSRLFGERFRRIEKQVIASSFKHSLWNFRGCKEKKN